MDDKEIDLYIIRGNTVPKERYVTLFMANGGVCHTSKGCEAMHFADPVIAQKQADELNRMRNRRTAYVVIAAQMNGVP